MVRPSPLISKLNIREGFPKAWRVPLICALLALLQGTLFVSSNAVLTGHLSLPLDDSFIHMQYGTQIAEGYYFRYQASDGVSGGATSFLYPHMIALGHLIGFRGMSLILWLYLIAWASVSALFYFLYALATRWGSPATGIATVALVFLSGVSAWAYWGGMEIALFSALLLWFFHEWTRPQPMIVPLAIAAALLALTRPEGTIIAVISCGIMLSFALLRQIQLHPSSIIQKSFAALIFLAAIVGPPIFYKLTLGRFGGNSLLAKSLLSNPIHTVSEKISELITNVVSMLLYLNGMLSSLFFSGEYVPPLLLILACVGISVLWKRFGSALALRMVLPLTVVFFAVATLEVWALHNFRYLTPFLPLMMLLGVIGVQSIVPKQSAVHAAVLVCVALVSLAHFPTWVSRYGQESSAIYEKQVRAARWVTNHLPGNTPVAINDAGVLAYESNRPVFDLVGLVSNPTTISYRVGEGALYETLQTLPQEERPQYAMIFPGWFVEMANRFDIFYRPQVKFPDPFDPTFGKTLYQINWFYTGPEEDPRPLTMKPNWVVKDKLDVADLESEAAHDYSIDHNGGTFPDVPNPFRRNFGYHEEVDLTWPGVENEVVTLFPQLWADGRIYEYDIVDAGRRITGSESFTIGNLEPERDVHLILRTCDNDGQRSRFHKRIGVECNGVFLGEWSIEGTPWNWYESVFTIPKEYVTSDEIWVRLRALGTREFPHFDSYTYWACQTETVREDVPYSQQPIPLSF